MVPPEYQCYMYSSYCLTLYNSCDVDTCDIDTMWSCDEIGGFIHAKEMNKYAILGGVGYPKQLL